ncbi:MAG: virB2 [Candidatus Midichloriaceae bacterium]|jgi:type IV secretion system protein VirB2|nr:virB2 [Candidatus Midichloriaceae bacterium]
MNIADQMKLAWKACMIAFFAITLSLVAPANPVKAEETKTQISNIICNAVNQLTGPIGRAIAILIIISLAISLFLGKVSWGMAIAVAVGMGILFGAKNVVELLAGTGTGSGVCDNIAH